MNSPDRGKVADWQNDSHKEITELEDKNIWVKCLK